MYPVKTKVSSAFLTELNNCEFGRYEDAVNARSESDEELIRCNDYQTVFCDFGDRFKTVIECRNDAELCELYYACASGTIGVNGYTRQANKVLDNIREQVKKINPDIVKRLPYQDGF